MNTTYNVQFNNQNAGLQVGHIGGNVYYGLDGQADLEREVLQWISKIPYHKHHGAVLKGLLPGSGEWLLQKAAFQEWLTSNKSSTLWLHGIPGCGKTRLVAHIIEKLSRKQGFAYFYCTRDSADTKRADPDEILRSLLRQLVTHGELPKELTGLYRKNKKEAAGFDDDPVLLSTEQCIAIILETVASLSLILIIDALDECDPSKRHVLMNALEELVNKASGKVKIFISSRDDRDIIMRMNATSNIMVSAGDNGVDIERYVDIEIDRAIRDRRLLGGAISSELTREIKSALRTNAHGMFQWVNLVIQSICEFHRLQLAEDVLAEITKLPSGLRDMYGLALHRISDKGEQSQKAAICTLRWLLGAQVSLVCVEFTYTISTITGIQLKPQDILDLCDNLITIDSELNIFRFAHLSVREFLESDIRFSESSMHSSLGLQCLEIYLGCAETMQPISMDVGFRTSYVQYACYYWPIHLYLGKWTREHALLDNILEPDKQQRPNFCHWVWLLPQQPPDHLSNDFRLRMELSFGRSKHPIFLVIAFGLEHYVNKMATSLTPAPKNRFYQSPLAVACTLANHTACQVLIKSGSDLDSVDGNRDLHYQDTPLSANPVTAAALGQHWTITNMLISASVDLDLNGIYCSSGSVLHIAVHHGQLLPVQYLITAGADMNSLSDGRTPLQCAAFNGFVEISRFLLSCGADSTGNHVSVQPRRDALKLASANGHLEIVKMLLKAGVPIDDNSSESETALAKAAHGRHIHVVKYLLKQGAQPNITSGAYGTPFLPALARGGIEMVQTFLDHGADINHKSTSQGNALVVAACCKDDALFSFLLETGADTEGDVIFMGRATTAQAVIAEKVSLDLLKEYVRHMRPTHRQVNYTIMLRYLVGDGSVSDKLENTAWLLDQSTQINAPDLNGTTLMHLAVRRGSVSLVSLLLEKGASLAAISKIYGSQLQAMYHHEWKPSVSGMLEVLVAGGADVNVQGGFFGTALQAASFKGAAKDCNTLLELGATEPKQIGYFGSPLIAAAAMANYDIVHLLLKHDLNVDATSKTCGTALQTVACLGHLPAPILLDTDKRKPFPELRDLRAVSSYRKIFQLLLNSGANVHSNGGLLGTALQAASYAGQLTFVQHLLRKGATLDSRIGFYGCSLQAASCKEIMAYVKQKDSVITTESQSSRYLKIIDLLLEHGADVNEKGGYFHTALQAACYSLDTNIVRRLLDAGAVVCEDGHGYYGGCIYASISFGKVKVPEAYENAAAILELILAKIERVDILKACQAAISRAKKEGNQDGLRLLYEVLVKDNYHAELFGQLFSGVNREASEFTFDLVYRRRST